MYKADRPDILSVVLNSDGFADMLERGEFIRRIADQDRRIVIIVRAAKKDATQTAARLDSSSAASSASPRSSSPAATRSR
jgi:hypothetical protein